MRNWKDLRDVFWCFLRKYSWTWNRGIIYLFTLLNKHYHFKSWTGGVWPSTGSKAAPVPEHKSSLLTKRISEVAQMLQCPPLKFTAWFLSVFVRFTKYNDLLPSGKNTMGRNATMYTYRTIAGRGGGQCWSLEVALSFFLPQNFLSLYCLFLFLSPVIHQLSHLLEVSVLFCTALPLILTKIP